MGFEVRVNGERVAYEERQVVGVSLMSSRGELYNAGISSEGAIDIVLRVVQDGDPIRLDQLEAAQMRARAEFVKQLSTGQTPYEVNSSMGVRQEVQDNTLRPGGPNPELTQLGQLPPPSVDLAQGLDPTDGEALTVRIEAYMSHGDAQRAVDENGPTDPNAASTQPASSPTESTSVSEPDGAVVEPQPTGTTSDSPGTVTSPSEATPAFSLGENEPPAESTPSEAQPTAEGESAPTIQ